MDAIAGAVLRGSYRYTVHGARQRIERRLSGEEIEEAIQSGEIIEDYPEHHYGPCCLILGYTRSGKALHLVCSCRSVGRHHHRLRAGPRRMGARSPDQEDEPMSDQVRCSICGAQVRAETTTYVQEIEGRLAAVTAVPVQVCPQCGEHYFSPETVDRLQRLLTRSQDAEAPPKTIEVPVYPFS
jgi:YgiT-type zinc finger domain-containing protein